MKCAYKNLTKEQYVHKIATFATRFDLRYFLINTLSQLENCTVMLLPFSSFFNLPCFYICFMGN